MAKDMKRSVLIMVILKNIQLWRTILNMCECYLEAEGWPRGRKGFSQQSLGSAPGLGAGGQIYKDLSLAGQYMY